MYYDDHDPPHFHAKYGEYEITVETESGVVKGEFPRRGLAHVLEWHQLHREELMNSIGRSQGLRTDMTACLWGLLLAVGSLLAWAASLDREPLPLGAALRLAAVGLVVLWSHYLLWLFGKMLNRRISNGYCVALFFGAWAVFFLIYNCLV